MKAILISSAVTFVPRNYNEFILPMAKDPNVSALVIIENRSFKIFASGVLLVVSGAAPRLGFHLMMNTLFPGNRNRQEAFKKENKQFFIFNDLHSEAALAKLRELQPDLIVNARTRTLFKNDLLSIPRWGCINIHHGLLPDQRGLMCDFWSHLEKVPTGFSIHQMTEKIDHGSVLRAFTIQSDFKNYTDFIFAGSREEAKILTEVLSEIDQRQSVSGEPNSKTEKTRYRKNPTWKDFYRLKGTGTKI